MTTNPPPPCKVSSSPPPQEPHIEEDHTHLRPHLRRSFLRDDVRHHPFPTRHQPRQRRLLSRLHRHRPLFPACLLRHPLLPGQPRQRRHHLRPRLHHRH